jgi:hypothetical protein
MPKTLEQPGQYGISRGTHKPDGYRAGLATANLAGFRERAFRLLH